MKERFSIYMSLTKPRIGLMVLVTTSIGYYLASGSFYPADRFILTLTGTFLAVAGSAALNNYLERDSDGLMERTRNRPLPRGLVPPGEVLVVGVLLVMAGVHILLVSVNLLTAFLALLSSFLYVLVYTPLKKVHWLNTFIGAIPGALPPVGGWAAATGKIGFGAVILFLILFIWQHPHFYAIAWIYRDDYKKGGHKMLPVCDTTGIRTARQTIFYSLILIPVSLMPFIMGITGVFYCISVLILGLLMLYLGVLFAKNRKLQDARHLMLYSLVYLPALLVLIVTDLKL
ncbi:MAG: protoheme IX farnesyltransferase [Candidatus Dadabacteria bacterium]|nr:MAG: protoheme IX farnesyltransferase [Candidatus Dadabacteria bacterium]